MRDLQAYVKYAMSTGRDRGAVGAKAITPRYVATIVRPTETVLNFGAGVPSKETGLFRHSEMLRAVGAKVWEYTFGQAKTNLGYEYDIVMASNVLNVQGDRAMLFDTLIEIRDCVKAGGIAVFNYPDNPRPAQIPVKEVFEMIAIVFGRPPVRIMGYGSKETPLWQVQP